MNFKETLEKVEKSDLYGKFGVEHPNAELCAGFFIMDFLSNDSKDSIDYKDGDKIFTFNLVGDEVKMYEDKLMDLPNVPKLGRIDAVVGVEVDELKGIAMERAHEEGIGAKFNKIIAVLQKHEDKQVWNLTCMLDQLIILNILVDCNSGEILKFERKSFMDMVKTK